MKIHNDSWIHDPENNGYGEGAEIKCPACGDFCETIYMDMENQFCGCEHCMKTMNSFDWLRKYYGE